MLQTIAAAPNWDGLYGSLWGNSVALVAIAIIAVMLAPVVLRVLKKTAMRIVVLVLVVLVVGFFAVRVVSDIVEINGFKNKDYGCGPVMSEDGVMISDKPCY